MNSITRVIGTVKAGTVIRGFDYNSTYGFVLLTDDGMLYANADKEFVPVPMKIT